MNVTYGCDVTEVIQTYLVAISEGPTEKPLTTPHSLKTTRKSYQMHCSSFYIKWNQIYWSNKAALINASNRVKCNLKEHGNQVRLDNRKYRAMPSRRLKSTNVKAFTISFGSLISDHREGYFRPEQILLR